MAKEHEWTVIQLIRRELEKKVFPFIWKNKGEDLHKPKILVDIQKQAETSTGRKIDGPKKEKEGD